MPPARSAALTADRGASDAMPTTLAAQAAQHTVPLRLIGRIRGASAAVFGRRAPSPILTAYSALTASLQLDLQLTAQSTAKLTATATAHFTAYSQVNSLQPNLQLNSQATANTSLQLQPSNSQAYSYSYSELTARFTAYSSI